MTRPALALPEVVPVVAVNPDVEKYATGSAARTDGKARHGAKEPFWPDPGSGLDLPVERDPRDRALCHRGGRPREERPDRGDQRDCDRDPGHRAGQTGPPVGDQPAQPDER